MKDDLLQHLVGKWNIERKFATRTAHNTARVTLTLQGHWLLIAMRDTLKPSRYAADVYITRMQDGTYSIHWLDTYGGTLPESLGTGTREGDSIAFVWKDADGELKNTFSWHPDTHSWTSEIVQKSTGKAWETFCVDSYTKAKS